MSAGAADLSGILGARSRIPAAPAPGLPPPLRAWIEHIMGMPISVHVRGPRALHGEDVQQAVQAVFDCLRLVDALFSTYKDDSEVSRINRGELSVADSHPLVRQVVDLCDEAVERTDGYFDPHLPTGDGGRWFDPSGLVKGWAVEEAAAVLRQIGDHDHHVNAAGDITAFIHPAGSPDWLIGLEDPLDRTRLLGAVPLGTGGIATSGTAARGAHIIEPHTGEAATDLLAVTVIGPSLLWADVYATAAVARGTDALAWLTGLDDVEALVVDPSGAITTTPGMPFDAGDRPLFAR